MRRALPLLLWAAALVVGTALFHSLGSGALEAPPLDPGGWSAWADGKDPLVATVAVLRLVVLALSWYLVGATTIGIVARLSRAARFVRVADALTIPMVRRLLQGALGVSLATAMVAAAVPGTTPGAPRHVMTAPEDPTVTLGARSESGPGSVTLASPPPSVTLRRVAEAPTADVPEVGVAEQVAPETGVQKQGGDDEVTLGHAGSDPPLPFPLTDAERDGSDDTRGSGDGRRLPASGADTDRTSDDAPDEVPVAHEVVAGESLWSIASDALTRAWGRSPSDAEVVGYWHEVIETNRGALDDPDNPDLIFPGQTFSLPPTPDA